MRAPDGSFHQGWHAILEEKQADRGAHRGCIASMSLSKPAHCLLIGCSAALYTTSNPNFTGPTILRSTQVKAQARTSRASPVATAACWQRPVPRTVYQRWLHRRHRPSCLLQQSSCLAAGCVSCPCWACLLAWQCLEHVAVLKAAVQTQKRSVSARLLTSHPARLLPLWVPPWSWH